MVKKIIVATIAMFSVVSVSQAQSRQDRIRALKAEIAEDERKSAEALVVVDKGRVETTDEGVLFVANPNRCGDPKGISKEFRETAGDAFDEVSNLEDSKLKGQLFYEPILHDAQRAVSKAKRKAISKDEQALAACLERSQTYAEQYREEIVSMNLSIELSKLGTNKSVEIEKAKVFLRTLESLQKKAGDTIRELVQHT
jgi:hypothetical protein